ncbi:ABC transporter permease [Shewanella surugensis]|uniref:ABC transporter permease n=1 Tax=Shewanella surugensis TaxID=212020 RepID=A0ABT0LAF6_9GAMM|nr:ABC transporter permease [Shewanella surugensis]MCL1124664.1 ABC transporter permease [Shewanella surugensis]
MFNSTLVRNLLKAKQYYATVVLSLTLTLTIVFVVFSIVDTVLLKALPYGDSKNLYVYQGYMLFNGQHESGTNSKNLLDVKETSQGIADIGMYFSWSDYKLLELPSRPDVPVFFGSSNLFEVLKVKPVLGRFFDEREQLGNKQPSAILSFGAWQQHFAGDDNIIGKSIQLNERRFTVIGVTSDHWSLPDDDEVSEGIWLPLDMDEQFNPIETGSITSNVRGVMRLADGQNLKFVTEALIEKMQAAAVINMPRAAKMYELNAQVEPFIQALRGDSVRLVWMLITGASLLTLMALINLGNVQVARGMSRVKYLAVSYAFGAKRKQLFKESLKHNFILLSVPVLLALFFTILSFELVQSIGSNVLPRLGSLSMSLNIVLFAVLMCAGIALLFSWIELSLVNEASLLSSLQSSGKGTGKQLSRGVSHSLIGLQLLFSVLTLVATSQVLMGTLTETLRPTHINTHNLWSLEVNYALIDNKEERKNLQRAISQHFMAQENVKAVSRASDTRVPFIMNHQPLFNEKDFKISNVRAAFIDDKQLSLFDMQLQGLAFTQDDMLSNFPPVIISQRLADQFSGSPIGKKVKLYAIDNFMTIVGIVSNTDYPGQSRYEVAEIFIPSVFKGGRTDVLLMQVSDEHEGFSLSDVYNQLTQIDPRLDIARLSSIEDDFNEISQDQRFGAILAGGLSFISLLMVIAGIAGMVSYMVNMRRYDLGVRLAMGANNKRLLRSQLWQLAQPLMVSFLFAFALAYFALGYSRTIPQWHFAIYWTEMFLGLVLLSVFVALACFMPIAKVLRTDPIKALRNE